MLVVTGEIKLSRLVKEWLKEEGISFVELQSIDDLKESKVSVELVAAFEEDNETVLTVEFPPWSKNFINLGIGGGLPEYNEGIRFEQETKVPEHIQAKMAEIPLKDRMEFVDSIFDCLYSVGVAYDPEVTAVSYNDETGESKGNIQKSFKLFWVGL